MSTATEAQTLLQFPLNHQDTPKQIIRAAFARAKAAVNNVLDKVEQVILATPLTWLAAVIISIVLSHAVSTFVAAVLRLRLLAKKRIPFRVGTLPEEQSQDLGDVYEVLAAESENLAVD